MVTKKQMSAVMKKAARLRKKYRLTQKQALKRAWGRKGRVHAVKNARGKLRRKKS